MLQSETQNKIKLLEFHAFLLVKTNMRNRAIMEKNGLFK